MKKPGLRINNLQRPNFKSLTFLNVNVRFFSTSLKKFVETDMMKKINEMLTKSKAFDKQVQTSSDLFKENQKMGDLKKIEWNRLEEFAQKYIRYLNKENQKKVEELFNQGERMDLLIKEKILKVDLSKSDEIEKSLKLVDMSFDSRYKVFNKLFDMFKLSIDKQTSDGTIKKVEGDVFNILLARRNQEKEIFLNEKASSFKKIYEKINASKKVPDSIDKLDPIGKVTPSTFVEGNIPEKAPLSEELLNIVKEVLDIFT
jgi:hypothetical protein